MHHEPLDSTTRKPLTKVLATLGPATDDPKVLRKLIEHGATLFRLNFSHGEFNQHHARLSAVREAAEEFGLPIAVLADLPGPKIRVGTTPTLGIMLETGEDVLIRGGIKDCIPGDPTTIACNYERIAVEVDPGDRVLINDGAVRLLAVVSDGEQLLCRVTHGGLVTSRKGLNLPDSDLTIPSTTDRDLEIVDWVLEHEIDYLAMSFVRTGEDVRSMHERLNAACSLKTGPDSPSTRLPLIAKIETPQAVENIEQILDAADGIMVARGDLGVEIELARVPVIQKQLIRAAHAKGRPCIVATQMLESMIDSATPTRAEVSDVANAVYDDCDAVMLSGETAVGKHPVLAVEVMRRVALATEESLREMGPDFSRHRHTSVQRTKLETLANGAWHMAHDINASIAVIWSQDGELARHISRSGLHVPIVAFTSDPRAFRAMNLYYAIVPVLLDEVPQHRSGLAVIADRVILERGLADEGDQVILLGGKPFDDPASANTVALRTVGEMTHSV